jgi:LysR family hydrogen peroxide-inducible transcriptional activator
MKQLQYLVALSETGSFSNAAAQCFVTQSTLSASIISLEENLGHSLVDRSQRAVKLTPLGHAVIDKAHQILAQAQSIIDMARALDAPLSGTLRLGVIPTIAPYFLPRLLPHIQSNYPQLTLQLHEDISERLVAQLDAGHLDLLLIALPYKMANVTSYPLFKEDFWLTAPKNIWRGPSPIPAASLQGLDLLLLDDGHCLRDHALEACALQPMPTKKTFSATSLPTLIQMVAHGYGMTILPEMAIETVKNHKDVDILPFQHPAPQRTIGLAWRKGSPRADEFMMLAKIAKKTGEEAYGHKNQRLAAE